MALCSRLHRSFWRVALRGIFGLFCVIFVPEEMVFCVVLYAWLRCMFSVSFCFVGNGMLRFQMKWTFSSRWRGIFIFIPCSSPF